MAKKILPPIHLACATKDGSSALQYVEILDGIATATNAHVLARLNMETHSLIPATTLKALSGKLIHRDVWETVLEADFIEVEGDTLHYSKGGAKGDLDITVSEKFPDYSGIIKAIANSAFGKKSFVCLDPKLIQIAAKLFPSKGLVFRFYEADAMTLVFPSFEPNGFVGIMPMQLDEEDAVLDLTTFI